MLLSRLIQSISLAAGTFSLVAVHNFMLMSSAQAFSVTFSNGSFDDPIDGSGTLVDWLTIGDVNTVNRIDNIDPLSGVNQAIITTGYIQGNYPAPISNRNDDNDFNFNQSGTNPVNADVNNGVDELQSHFGFGTDAFSIARVGGTLAGITPRTSKEGSGMYQQFDVTLDAGEDGFKVEFNWSYLTNDGSTSLGGEQDFSFWSLGQYNSGTDTYTTAFSSTGNPNDDILVLKSSSGAIISPGGNNDYVSSFDYATNDLYSYEVSGLAPGTYTYRVGFGVVDVDGTGRSSALLIDSLNIKEIPFKFAPSFGLIFITGFYWIMYFLRKLIKSN